MDRDSYKWGVVALFWVVYFLNQADRQVLFSVFPLIKTELKLSNTQLGLLGSSFQWVYAILVPVSGFLGDRLNRRNLIVVALLAWSATTFSSGLIGGFLLLLILRGLTGTGEAFYYPAATSIISDLHGQRTRSLAMSVHQTSLYCGIVSSGVLAGYLGEKFGWQSAFMVFGGCGIVALFLVIKILKEPVRGQADLFDDSKSLTAKQLPQTHLSLRECAVEAYRTPTAIILTMAFVGMNFAGVAFLTWTPTLLYQKFHFGLARAGFDATFYHQAGAFVGVLAGGKLADNWALHKRVGRPLVQMVGLLLATPFIYLAARASSIFLSLAALGLFGIFRGLYDSNLFASLYEVVAPRARATATGLMLAIAFLVGGSSSLIIGEMSNQMGLERALASASFWYAGAGILVLLDCCFWFSRDAEKMQARTFGSGHSVVERSF